MSHILIKQTATFSKESLKENTLLIQVIVKSGTNFILQVNTEALHIP